jgi:hypothetical protein
MHTQAKVMGQYEEERDVARCDCGPSSVVRNRYFYSMLLESQDMAQDQAFHLNNMRHHIAELHGFGTVCGLRVEKTQCHEQVRVRRGVAVDCLGREIRVEQDVLLDLHAAVEQALELRRKKEHARAKEEHEHRRDRDYDRQHDDGDDDDDDDDECEDPVDVFVSLCYRETDERPVQALGGPETCCKPGCEMSRTRHGFCLVVSAEPPKSPRRIRDLLDDLYKCEDERLGEWLCHWMTEPCWQCEPDPCGRDHQCVGLARVRVVPGGSVEAIDNCCVRPLVLPSVLIAAMAEYAITKSGRDV